MPRTVVHLGQIRDLMKRWDEVRVGMAGQRVKGFVITLLDERDEEKIYLGGTFEKDADAALRAQLRMSMEMNSADLNLDASDFPETGTGT